MWNLELYLSDHTHGHRDYYRALMAEVRADPTTYDVPVYVVRDGGLVLKADAPPLGTPTGLTIKLPATETPCT